MRSNDLSKLKLQLETAGIRNASEVLNRIIYWTNGRKSQTETLVKKIQHRPQTDWHAKSVDQLVERTYLWPEIKGVIQQGRVGKAILNHPKKTEILKTYLYILNGNQVRYDEEQPIQHVLIKLGLLQEVDRLLKPINRIYTQIFDAAWVQDHLEDPPIWEDVQETIIPWLTPRNIVLGIVALAIFFGGLFVFTRPQPDQGAENLTLAQVEPPTQTASGVTATATNTPNTEPTVTPPPLPPTVSAIISATVTVQKPLATEEVQSKLASNSEEEKEDEGQEKATLLPTQTPPTQTVTATQTVTQTATDATREQTQERVDRVFKQPQLLNLYCYEEWANFAPNNKIRLRWSWGGWLGWNEYLEVRVGPNGGTLKSMGRVFAEPVGTAYEWFITPQGQFLDGKAENYQWQVVHMAADGRTVLAQSPRGCFTVRER